MKPPKQERAFIMVQGQRWWGTVTHRQGQMAWIHLDRGGPVQVHESQLLQEGSYLLQFLDFMLDRMLGLFLLGVLLFAVVGLVALIQWLGSL
ncbi:MAG: hypothetical protein U0271_24560 [Polyangiaceae bacterium]